MNPTTAAPASAEDSNCVERMDPSLECAIESLRGVCAPSPRADYSPFSRAAQQGCVNFATREMGEHSRVAGGVRRKLFRGADYGRTPAMRRALLRLPPPLLAATS